MLNELGRKIDELTKNFNKELEDIIKDIDRKHKKEQIQFLYEK